jgi:hypothetical protein
MDPDMKNISEYVKIIRQAHVTKVNTIRDAFDNADLEKCPKCASAEEMSTLEDYPIDIEEI